VLPTGATVSGRPILDFGGTYPSTFASRSTRRLVSGDTSYHVASSFSVSAGARYEREQAFRDPRGTRRRPATTVAHSSKVGGHSASVIT
jgi:hypothetical protein